MRTAYFDSGLNWDDPNLRWGEPAYLLEPGDPGYTPTLPPNTETKAKNKTKKMRRNNFFPMRQGDQITWLGNYKTKLPGYATTLALAAGQVTAIGNDCGWAIYVLQSWVPAVRSWTLAGTDALNEALTGSGSAAQTLPVFTAPALPAGVTAVNPGALNRIFALVQQIKDGGKCTDAIAQDLGIVGSANAGPDLTTIAPVIAVNLAGGHVQIKWGWQGNAAFLDLCEIHVDRGDGQGFKLLTFDTTPNYTDTQPLPATPARWTYKAIYRVGDAQVGNWSAPISINVAG